MLISVTLQNWKSFRDKTRFSMAACDEALHEDRVPVLNRPEFKILPITAIFGGNASGKTNFFEALEYAQATVLDDGDYESSMRYHRLRPDCFELDSKSTKKPTRFIFVILAGSQVYEYSFSVYASTRKISAEKLTIETKNGQTLLYKRKFSKIEYGDSVKNTKTLDYAFNLTRGDRLFLTMAAASKKHKPLANVYNWFKDTLEFVSTKPDLDSSRLHEYYDTDSPYFSILNKYLAELDTGISHVVSEKNEKLHSAAPSLASYHKTADGTLTRFEVGQETSGVQRIIGLLPSLLNLHNSSNSPKVCVFDELDRSLHTMLSRKLIKDYLSKCSATSRSQLLFTTYDLLLMDTNLLRTDEMWLAKRDYTHASSLTSLCEFKGIDKDKNIRESYLDGRFGGIPVVLLDD